MDNLIDTIEYKQRIAKVRDFITTHHMDGFLVTDSINVGYLSGFTGDEGILLITSQRAYLISDARFQNELMNQNVVDYRITSFYLEEACHLFEKDHLVAVGFEETISYRQFDYLDEHSVADLVPVDSVIEYFRSIKSESEISLIKKSTSIAQQGYMMLLQEDIHEGTSEKEIANQLDFKVKHLGAESASFDPIVASGIENTVEPHHISSKRIICKGDLILIDYGYFYKGYTSDITRMCSVGKQPEQVKALVSAVKDSLDETTQIITDGLPISALREKAVSVLKRYHLDKYFTHGIGHGIGMSIHEMPSLGSQSDNCLQDGQVITIEPGVYLPSIGGVRLENDILVTKNGYENLTNFQIDMVEL